MHDIRLMEDAGQMRQVTNLFDQVWGSSTPMVAVELACAIQHAGGYVAAAFLDEQVVGASLGFLGRHDGAAALHSHLTGVLPGVRATGLGRALKLHQRRWAGEHGLAWVTWTFDPLVRRNAWFNLHVLGATAREYLVDFYGPIDDALNAGDESDRVLVEWATDEADGPPEERSDDSSGGAVTVATPEDIVVLRRTDPAAAQRWRHRVRDELGGRLSAGDRVVTFTKAGAYVIEPGGSS